MTTPEPLLAAADASDPLPAARDPAAMVTCRHCGGEITPCAEPIQFCKGWKHAAYIHYGPIGPHYCEGRSVNPLAEPPTSP